jgi:hypothetical protein
MPDLTFSELRALGCGSCGGDIDTEGQCVDCGEWISGLEPDLSVSSGGQK